MRRTLGELLLTDKMRERVKRFPASGFINLSPGDFLKLTTTSDQDASAIAEKSHSVEQYNQWVREGEILITPFLDVDRYTGKICSHEGRHRAAALLKEEPGTRMKVAVVLRDRNCRRADPIVEKGEWGTKTFRVRHLGVKDLPKSLVGQYRADVSVPVEKNTWDGLHPAGWHKPGEDEE